MKTFEEALDMMHGETPQATAKAKDHVLRGMDVSKEVIDNPKTADLIWAMIRLVDGEDPCEECEICMRKLSLAMTAS